VVQSIIRESSYWIIWNNRAAERATYGNGCTVGSYTVKDVQKHFKVLRCL
jgi:hypothetical protein